MITISPLPDDLGFYGEFGGSFVPELMRKNLDELTKAFRKIQYDETFRDELKEYLQHYVGRPSPLYRSQHLSESKGCDVFLKREDLNHTGSHKINNAIGQALLARRMGKTTIIAETGAGQHGVATATACALFGLHCKVFMGEKDMQRQHINVQKMKMLGAEVVAAQSGSKTLKDATNEAIRHWINHPDCYYLIGSVVGPAPYPELVTYFQSIISEEIRQQLERIDKSPTHVLACVGGGSNAAGAFYHFYENENVKLIAVEAGGWGIDTNKTAATCLTGTPGILHGSRTLVQQNESGQITEPHSISAGLDYPGIGPLHAFSYTSGRAQVLAVTDEEALLAGKKMMQNEGILPALESAHALAALEKMKFKVTDVVVVNLSGRGDKDLLTFLDSIHD